MAFFVYEDRANITDLIREILEWLAVAEREVLSQDLTAKTLWENFIISWLILYQKSGSSKLFFRKTWIPSCTLRKAHLIEKVCETNAKILSNIEICLQLCERSEYLSPLLKLFFCGKKGIVLADIMAITK